MKRSPLGSIVKVVDMFCGAGGSSLGAVAAGADVILAMNHWQIAIDTHSRNFPATDHLLADVSMLEPRRMPRADVLIASPECQSHSLAKGRKRRDQAQLGLLEPRRIDPAEERSRVTMYDPLRFAEEHRYELVILENVVDVNYWLPLRGWLMAWHDLGYEHKFVYANSQFFPPTPQSRDRLYMVFWRRGNRAPDLDIRPAAHCAKCGRVDAVQSWKPGRSWGRYGKQYVYCCPRCAGEVRPLYTPAAAAIDWSLPAPRVGDRAKPLKEKTLKRIEAGLKKFGGQGFMADVVHTPRGSYSSMVSSLDEPHRTVIGQSTHGLVTPPFIVGYYTRPTGIGAAVSGVDDPMPTQSTQPRHYLVQPGRAPAVEDCGFRMLTPGEIQAAMAFPADYEVLGTKRDKVKLLGNAVTPPVMAELVRRSLATLS